MRNKSSDAVRESSVISKNVPFQIREAYKAARTNLIFTLSGVKGCKKIIVSSACPAEGKTTTVINLAVAMAETNAKVLVIDADMRRPAVHKYLGIKNTTGLSNVLCGFTKLDQVVKKTEYGFDCMTAGSIPPNPSELLMSDVMENLINLMETHYEYIFIDTPPIAVVSDALAITKYVSGVVLTARQNITTTTDLENMVSSLKFADAKILGVVFNDVEQKKGRRRYYGKKRYDYKYYYLSGSHIDG